MTMTTQYESQVQVAFYKQPDVSGSYMMTILPMKNVPAGDIQMTLPCS
jgi:hypothetical protein